MSRRVAVVTGSNKGIGLAIVKELCATFDGDVYLTSRDESRGKAAIEQLRNLGLKPHYHQLDIDDESSVVEFRDYLKKTYGGLDVLVNNAAIAFKNAATEPFGEQATITLRTNFFNTLKACQTLFPILRPHARVVNMSSYAGHLTKISGQEPEASLLRKQLSSPDLTIEQLSRMMREFIDAAKRGDHFKLGWPNSTYVVSKVGLSALTRIQQREFRTDPRGDIVINHVNPGYVDTDMTSHKGVFPVEYGAAAPSWLALLPPNVDTPKGEFVWHDKTIVDWINGPAPPPY